MKHMFNLHCFEFKVSFLVLVSQQRKTKRPLLARDLPQRHQSSSSLLSLPLVLFSCSDHSKEALGMARLQETSKQLEHQVVRFQYLFYFNKICVFVVVHYTCKSLF